MLAQRTESHRATIEAVEIDKPSCLKAQENFDASDWADRIRLHSMSAQEFARKSPTACFEHIISNPPYFVDSLNSHNVARNIARHASTLPHEELLTACCKLLANNGIMSLILPSAEGEKMVKTAAGYELSLSRIMEVWPTRKSGPKRLLLEFSRRETDLLELPPLVIEDAGAGTFSEEYRTLTRDFYLYF